MAVLENGFPFDNMEYDATALGAWLSTRTRGVFSDDEHYAVTAIGGMQVSVSSGIAWLKMNEQWGMVAPNPAAISLAVDVGDTILNRIDVVCLRIDKNQSVQEVVVKKGSLAASPVYPALVRDLNYDEIFLAAISVPAGTTELNAGLLTDLRLDETYCGLMRDGVTGIPTAMLQEQAEALIASLQEAIDGVIDGSQYMLKAGYDQDNTVSSAGGIVPYLDSQLVSKANVGDSGKIITLWTGSVGVGGTIPLDPSELPSAIIVGMASDVVAFEVYRIGDGGFTGSSTYPQAGGNYRTMGVTLNVTGGVLTVFRSQWLDHIPSSNHNAGSQAVTVSSISVRL